MGIRIVTATNRLLWTALSYRKYVLILLSWQWWYDDDNDLGNLWAPLALQNASPLPRWCVDISLIGWDGLCSALKMGTRSWHPSMRSGLWVLCSCLWDAHSDMPEPPGTAGRARSSPCHVCPETRELPSPRGSQLGLPRLESLVKSMGNADGTQHSIAPKHTLRHPYMC